MKSLTPAFLPVFPNWFPYNDMALDGHMKVGQYAGVKTRNWNWYYRGPVLFYNSLRTAAPAVKAYGYKNTPEKHKMIIGLGELVDVRPLLLKEAKQMLANFNNMPRAEIERILTDLERDLGYSQEQAVYKFYDFGPFIAPFRNGFFFQNLKRFKKPVPFDWQPGPIKPIMMPISIVAKALKEIGINPKSLVR